jgi:hypothetical protein
MHHTYHVHYGRIDGLALKRSRQALRRWQRSIRFHESNAKLVISFIDHLEESKSLSHLERTLRRLIIRALQRSIQERVGFWKQRSKIKFAIDGDENSKYFHALATQRLRKNKIATIKLDGSEFSSHEHKMEILTNFYRQLLGHTFIPTWNFSLQRLYPTKTTNLSSLTTPFTQDEIVQAFFQINKNARPGP